MGLVDGKSVTGNRRDKVDSGQDNVVQTGFLLKAGQDDQTCVGDQCGRFLNNWLSRSLAK